LVLPHVEKRTADCESGAAILGLTVTPVCSSRLLRNPGESPVQDPRSRLVERIRASLIREGLDRYYDVRAGGRYSIDITRVGIDKGWALESIIRRRHVEGDSLKGQALGSLTIYFGDEVYPGGNDYPVAGIPGVLVVAVNKDQASVPSLPNVVTAQSLTGPQATSAVLHRLSSCTSRLQKESERRHQLGLQSAPKNALDLLREELRTECF
jgi:hypothetical protein